MVPKDLLYTDQHEWIRVEGDVGTVGITDHAQRSLGDLTFVELPATGSDVAKGAEAAVVESTKAAADVYSPAAGKVAEVNESLEDDPGAVNRDPYGDGWMFKVALSDKSELGGLLSPDKYAEFCGDEA